MTKKTALDPDEVLRVAYGHIILSIDQHALAAIMGINAGRIGEACKAMEWAMNNHMAIYRQQFQNAATNQPTNVE
jgi:hypothetical protein